MEFNEVVLNRINSIQRILAQKSEEYASSKSRFHNFEVAGRKAGTTSEKALLGMMMKHVVAVDDLVEWIEECPHKLTKAIIDEKIGDNINYLILLEGMLLNRTEHIEKLNSIPSPTNKPSEPNPEDDRGGWITR